VLDPNNSLTYSWTFGDGATSTLLTPSHAYANLGSYTATLRVTDSQNLSTTVTTTAVISAAPLVVSAGSSANVNEGSAAQLNGTASGGTGTLSYSWTFGDGGVAS